MKYLITILMLFSTLSHANIVQDNFLYIPVDSKALYKVSETQFNSVLDRLEKLYTPVIEERGAKLEIVRKWEDGTVNAYAQQSGKTWKITMFGGLARHDTITEDAFALVGCHELGHHIGGIPKYPNRWSKWATNEGQADYFGNTKCFRHYATIDNNVRLMSDVKVPKLVTKTCKKQFKDKEDVAICKRGAMAGLSLGNLFRAIRDQDAPLRFDSPDASVVEETYNSHPAPQCRLDTYFAGASCDRSEHDEVSDEDVNESVCNRTENDTIGVRPLCWYKPSE